MSDALLHTVIAKALYEHQWAGDEMPSDEADCCADVVIKALAAAGYQISERGSVPSWMRPCEVDYWDVNDCETGADVPEDTSLYYASDQHISFRFDGEARK